jgi:hypothetical protein
MPKTPAPATDAPPLPQAWLDASARTSDYLQRFMQGWQQAQARTLQNMGHDAEAAAEEAGRATGVQDLLGLQVAYATEEWARMMQFSSQMLASLLDVQAQWTRDMEAGAGAWLQGSLQGGMPTAAPVLPTLPDLLRPPGAMGLVEVAQAAQAAWAGTTKAWLDAINHDLEATGGEPAAMPVAEPAPAAPRRNAARSKASARSH